jgi:hypothetical protein
MVVIKQMGDPFLWTLFPMHFCMVIAAQILVTLQGTTFVEQLVEDESQMEGIPADCSQIMNWHVPFGSESLVYPKGWRVATNLDVIIPLK